MAVTRLTSSHQKRGRRDLAHAVGDALVADAGEAAGMSSSASSSITSTTSSTVTTPTRRLLSSTTGADFRS